MLRPASIGRSGRTRVWALIQRLQQGVSPRLCAVKHLAVTSAPPLVSDESVLGHTDKVVNIDPVKMPRSLRVGERARRGAAARRGCTAGFRRWLTLGGSCKHLQRHVSRNVHGRFIAPGDADLHHEPFTTRPTITDLLDDGLEPKDTVEYQNLLDSVIASEFTWTRGCRTRVDVDRYSEELTDLDDTIRTDGYRTQQELGDDGDDEVRIGIDRVGRPCVSGGGTHRLSTARLLGLSSVPVVIKRVHPLWVQRGRSLDGSDDVQEAIAQGVAALQVEPLRRRAS